MRRKINLKTITSLPHIVVFCVGFLAGYEYFEFDKGQWLLAQDSETQEINVCFTPPAGCGSLIAREIHKAHESLYIQAFSFTSELIADEVVKAYKRGVDVKVLLDRTQSGDKNSQYHKLEQAGIEVKIDHISGFAHNKVIIIDKRKVITGSYNFSKAADTRNADNVLMIDNPSVADAYMQNWLRRHQKSR